MCLHRTNVLTITKAYVDINIVARHKYFSEVKYDLDNELSNRINNKIGIQYSFKSL